MNSMQNGQLEEKYNGKKYTCSKKWLLPEKTAFTLVYIVDKHFNRAFSAIALMTNEDYFLRILLLN